MPLTSRAKLYRALPSCLADPVSSLTTKRNGELSVRPEVANRALMLSGESRRPLGRPPHCGSRNFRSKKASPSLSSGVRKQSPLTGISTTTKTNLYHGDSEPILVIDAWTPNDVSVLPTVRASRYQSEVDTLPAAALANSSSTVGLPVIDSDHNRLLNIHNVRGDASRPSSGGSSNSGRKRASPQSTALNESSDLMPLPSPRTALSLDNVDLWEDSNSDLSGSSASTTTAIALVRRTFDLGHSLTAANEVLSLETKNQFAFGDRQWAPSSRKIIRYSRHHTETDSPPHHNHQTLPQPEHREGSMPFYRNERGGRLTGNRLITQRKFTDMAGSRIPLLVESSGRPKTANRPAAAASSVGVRVHLRDDASLQAASSDGVRVHLRDDASLQLYVRGIRMLSAMADVTVAPVEEGIRQLAA